MYLPVLLLLLLMVIVVVVVFFVDRLVMCHDVSYGVDEVKGKSLFFL
jgi:hypothetical protein